MAEIYFYRGKGIFEHETLPADIACAENSVLGTSNAHPFS